MDTPDYGAIAKRIEAGEVVLAEDGPHIMTLIGVETQSGDNKDLLCRRGADDQWKACPRFDSADDFEQWVLTGHGGTLCDVGIHEDREHYVSYMSKEHGNDYGYSKSLGSAMWAAMVRVEGEVGEEGEDAD